MADIKVEPKSADIKVEPKSADIKVESKSADIKVEPKSADIENIKPEENSSTTAAPAEAKDQNGCADDKSIVKKSLSPEMTAKIAKQIEYYFGNYNLPRDKFLKEEVKKDDGWVSLQTMCSFKRLAAITTDHDLIVQSLKESSIIEVNDSDYKIRRSLSNPLPEFGEDLNEETVKRTIYLKGCKKDGSVTLDMLLEYFKQFGSYEAIKMRKFKNLVQKQTGFKGSILVIYPTVEGAKNLMEQDEVIFHNAPLLRKWYADYLEEKKKEIEERKAEKTTRQAKRAAKEAEGPNIEEKDPEPTGTYLYISELPKSTSREDIKAALAKYEIDAAFVGIKRGDEEGYIRLLEPFSNIDAVATLKGKLEIGDSESTIRAVVGTEECKQLKLAREVRSSVIAGCNKRKREGRGRGGRGHHYKRRKN